MNEQERTRLSKFLSLVLRHDPGAISVELDDAGWISIDLLLSAARAHGTEISRPMLEEIVATSPKRRFAFSDDAQHIRAVQGHSIDVDLKYEPSVPPDCLYHGTVESVISEITTQGLLRMSRRHVHLSIDEETARIVGARRGKPVVLVIAARRMYEDGFAFFMATNGVWLTERVPPAYIQLPQRNRQAR